MKLADILATKQKTIRCPACGKKLWWRSSIIATGRCPQCATRIVEDLPPLPEVAMVKPEDLVPRWKWKDIATLLFLVGFTLINLSYFETKTEDSTTFLDILVLVLGFLPVMAIGWIWQKRFDNQRLKCPSCGNPLHAPLVLEAGRCNRCGIGLQPAPPLKGQPAMTLAEYFRRQSRHDWWRWLSISVTILLMIGPWLLPVWHGWRIPMIISGIAYVWFWVSISMLMEFRVVCPDCRKRRFVPVPLFFLQRCGKCGRHLVDLDADGAVAGLRKQRRQQWWRWGLSLAGLVLAVALLWAGPFDCAPVAAPDLKPLPRQKVAEADNAWVYFSQAEQQVANVKDWSWLFDEKLWDETKANGLLTQYQPALALLEKGLACQIYQPPPAEVRENSSFKRLHNPSFGLLRLQMESQRHHGRLDVAVAIAFKMNRYGMLLQNRAETPTQYLVGMRACRQAITGLSQMAKDPAISAKTLILAERQLAPEAASTIWNPALDYLLKSQYELIGKQLQALSLDSDYRRQEMKDFEGLRFIFTTHFWHQPNRSQCEAASTCRQWLGSLDQPLSRMPKIRTMSLLLFETSPLSFNIGGRIVCDERIDWLRMSLTSNHHLRGEVALTRALLLCLAYEKKHGQLPDTLQALVPEFVEAVPLDPFDGKPVRYSKERQIVYCVGSDGKDNGAPKNEKGWGPQDEYSRQDQVLELRSKAKESL